jgi:low affinity Fe/Cu permease
MVWFTRISNTTILNVIILVLFLYDNIENRDNQELNTNINETITDLYDIMLKKRVLRLDIILEVLFLWL